jgi:hypothetical protein
LLHVKAGMAEEVEKTDLGFNTPLVLRNAIINCPCS